MKQTVTSRREFLHRGLTILALAPTVPAFLDQTVLAMADPRDLKRTQQPSGKDGKILVVLQLSGGNDGLNTVVPYADHNYYRAARHRAEDPKAVLKLDDYVGLHPKLSGLKKLYDDGKMSVVQGVGYPNPNRSHFRSMDIWQTAEPQKETVTTGWIGRYFDNACPGSDPRVGVSIGDMLPLAMQGDRVTPLAFERPETYRYSGPDAPRYKQLNRIEPAAAPKPAAPVPPGNNPHLPSPAGQLDFLQRTAMDAQLSSDELLRIVRGYHPSAEYPQGEFGQGLQTVAAMIGGGLTTRVYYVSLGGFDTHANQAGRHSGLMDELSRGVTAFWQDLAVQKNDDRVMMMTFSEFGRRVAQNASGGTDHGTAAPMMLFGKSLKPGVFGPHPSLQDLDQGDLRYHVDFRNVYATLLQTWLDCPSKPILGEQFRLLPLIKA